MLATVCICGLDTHLGPAGPISVLRVAGEIDSITCPSVATALTAVLDQAPHDVLLDLSGVGFCCVRGVDLLAQAARTARAAGIRFALCGLSTHLDRVLTAVWPDQPAVCYRHVAAAVTAVRLEQTNRHS